MEETHTEIRNLGDNASTLEEYLQTLIVSGKYNYQYTHEEKEKGLFFGLNISYVNGINYICDRQFGPRGTLLRTMNKNGFFYINEIPFNIPKWVEEHYVEENKIPLSKQNNNLCSFENCEISNCSIGSCTYENCNLIKIPKIPKIPKNSKNSKKFNRNSRNIRSFGRIKS